MELFFVLIALGTADQYGAIEENLFSRWDMLSLPSAYASDPQCVSFPRAGHPSMVGHPHLVAVVAVANEE